MDWGESIIDALTQSRAFVLVFSSHANSSPQIKREVERAVNHGLPIIPLRIEDVAPIKSLEYFISSPHWLDAFSPPLERHLNYLADILGHILEKKELQTRTVEFTRPAGLARGIVGRFRYALLGVSLAIVLAVATVAIWNFHTPDPSEKALTAGDAAAMNDLGNHYFDGNGVPKDYTEARKWYERAAAAGNVVAMGNVGDLYFHGIGVPVDFAEARRWYEKAAAAGNAKAMTTLGYLYFSGNGVALDFAEARKWFEKAAAAGNAIAMNNLGNLYFNGNGVPVDFAEARKWYEKAAAAGNEVAKANLKKLEGGKPN
jgi:TPR repeat protein